MEMMEEEIQNDRNRWRYRQEEQVKKNVEKRGIKWMEMMEEETWNDRDR